MFLLSNPHGESPKSGDYWLANGHKDWAFIDPTLAKQMGLPAGTPIRLVHGNERSHGARHIYKRERRGQIQKLLQRAPQTSKRYPKICKAQTYAPEYAWLKLNSGGTVYGTEVNGKVKITLAMTPNSLMVLNEQTDKKDDSLYLSITSLYPINRVNPDGDKLGRYHSGLVNPAI